MTEDNITSISSTVILDYSKISTKTCVRLYCMVTLFIFTDPEIDAEANTFSPSNVKYMETLGKIEGLQEDFDHLRRDEKVNKK